MSDKERTTLFNRYKGLACRVVESVVGKYDDDLFIVAAMGLWEATRKFNPNKNVSFSTYGFIKARGAVLRELRDRGHLIRPSRNDKYKNGAHDPYQILSMDSQCSISKNGYVKSAENNLDEGREDGHSMGFFIDELFKVVEKKNQKKLYVFLRKELDGADVDELADEANLKNKNVVQKYASLARKTLKESQAVKELLFSV